MHRYIELAIWATIAALLAIAVAGCSAAGFGNGPGSEQDHPVLRFMGQMYEGTLFTRHDFQESHDAVPIHCPEGEIPRASETGED